MNQLFPRYFSRKNHGISWHFRGELSDVVRVWITYIYLCVAHPTVVYYGLRQSFDEFSMRIPFLNKYRYITKHLSNIFPFLAVFLLVPIFVFAAAVPFVTKPKSFNRFSTMGLVNYCMMLMIVSIMHGNVRSIYKTDPALARTYASKMFWKSYFEENLSENSQYPVTYGVIKEHAIDTDVPENDFLVKPLSLGAGYKIHKIMHDKKTSLYTFDSEYDIGKKEMNRAELKEWLQDEYEDAVLEKYVSPVSSLPIHSLRVLTIKFKDEPELLSCVLLCAPNGSISTAHESVEAYLIDTTTSKVIDSCAQYGHDEVIGKKIPQLQSVLEECICLHRKMPRGHIQVSWDIILTDDKPMFLEGNVVPPGCDYKLMIYENRNNLKFFISKYFESMKHARTTTRQERQENLGTCAMPDANL